MFYYGVMTKHALPKRFYPSIVTHGQLTYVCGDW